MPSLQLDGECVEGSWPFPTSCFPHSVSVAQGSALSSTSHDLALDRWLSFSFSWAQLPPSLTSLFILFVLYSSLCWRGEAILTARTGILSAHDGWAPHGTRCVLLAQPHYLIYCHTFCWPDLRFFQPSTTRPILFCFKILTWEEHQTQRSLSVYWALSCSSWGARCWGAS